ncbi:sensor domain-containing protein [Mycolicibacterium sediminis]|uniref:sensor domain-containing protein n=1 Tax=Mycolicibacterium sediminis TaxID=1286180 RepID=UPI0013D38373|nr:sensor domain-containing protein [Mycolicibacterium sediminis]
MTSRRSSRAALLAACLLTGCSSVVPGSPSAAKTAFAVLPTEDQISTAVGNRLSTFDFEPFIGGAEILPDGYRTDADASPLACVAVTDTAPRVVYEALPVVEAARQSYFNWNPGAKTTGADAAVIRLASAEDAQRTFDDFARQWQECDGTSVVKHLRGVTDAEVDAAVSDVQVTGSVLVAAVDTAQRPQAAVTSGAVALERAVGVRRDTIVEVSLALSPGAGRSADPGRSAAAVATAMLDKVR